MHREREAEGDEFADKETFVTQAYKDQLAATRKAEEEEKAREGLSLLAVALSSTQSANIHPQLRRSGRDPNSEAWLTSTSRCWKRVRLFTVLPSLQQRKPRQLLLLPADQA